jgi:hypothetical protein
MEFRAVALALCVALIAMPAAAQRVIDGDTIDLNGTRWRLWGIDARSALGSECMRTTAESLGLAEIASIGRRPLPLQQCQL